MHEDAPDTSLIFKSSKRPKKLIFGVGKGPSLPMPRSKETVQLPAEHERKKGAVFVEKIIDRGRRRFCFKFPEVNMELRLTAATSDVVSSLLEHVNCIYPAEVILARSLSSDLPTDEDSKAQAKRILTAISKTFRTLPSYSTSIADYRKTRCRVWSVPQMIFQI